MVNILLRTGFLIPSSQSESVGSPWVPICPARRIRPSPSASEREMCMGGAFPAAAVRGAPHVPITPLARSAAQPQITARKGISSKRKNRKLHSAGKGRGLTCFFLLAVERRWSEMTNNGIHSSAQPESCSEPCFWQSGEHSPPPGHLRAPGDHPNPHSSTRDNQG